MAAAGRTIRQGLTVGLIAFASVALFYAAFALLAGQFAALSSARCSKAASIAFCNGLWFMGLQSREVDVQMGDI